ncbi:transcription elongation factor [Saccharata proteae CBS 121410]|uniref:Transcription elongation factor n=1 Tax=Saccharata proteae CBS 121410 TaxID=1314787 RepID=A0A9P4HU89_9PEZI|nr:transcription elongation factor [Saccharata proteae CBS 121410]
MALEKKDVSALGRDLTKADQAGEPAANLLKLLDDLRKGVKASEDMLRSTKIGITVNKLKQNKDPQVARTASELVSKWRNEIKKPGTGASTPKSTNGTASPAPSANSASAPPPQNAKPKLPVPPEQRSWKKDGVDYKVTGNAQRDNCLRLMYDGLAHMSEELPKAVLSTAREIELACYNKYQPEMSPQYRDRIRMLYQNLKNPENPGLRVRVLNGSITPAKFVVMTHDELKSDERKELDRKLAQENLATAMVPKEERVISTALTCGRCKQKKVAYTQAQTRSADEPMTTFCECTNCGNRWKFS